MPTAAEREKAKNLYNMSVNFTNRAKIRFGRADLQALEGTLGAYLQLLQQPIKEPAEGEDPETMEVSVEIMQQMALLAIGPLTRMVAHRYRSKG